MIKLELPKPKCYCKETAFDYEFCLHCRYYGDCDWNCYYGHEDDYLYYG